jgi:predicted DNA-binding protein (MmcQ/YjbR family)
MSNSSKLLARIRAFALGLPGAEERIQFGHPFFKVNGKPFAIYSDDTGEQLSVKFEKESQQVFLQDPRFTKTPYLGNHGWVTLTLPAKPDWEEVEELIRGSHEFVTTKPKTKKKRN